MNKFEKFVCDTYLSSFPSHKSYQTICTMIGSGHEDVTIWAPFENMSKNSLLHNMEETLLYINQLAQEIREEANA